MADIAKLVEDLSKLPFLKLLTLPRHWKKHGAFRRRLRLRLLVLPLLLVLRLKNRLNLT